MVPFNILKTQSFCGGAQLLKQDGYIETDCTEKKSIISDRLFLYEYTLYGKNGKIIDRVYHAEHLDNMSKPFHDFLANKNEWLTAEEAAKLPLRNFFPNFLNSSNVVYYSLDGDYWEYTTNRSEPENTVFLAICKDKNSYLLVRCDENFGVLGSSVFNTIEDCKHEADKLYNTYIQWVRK